MSECTIKSRPGQILGYRKDGRPIFAIAGGEPTVRERLEAERSTLLAGITELLGQPVPANAAEAAVANQEIEERQAQVDALDNRIKQLNANEQRRAADGDANQRHGNHDDGVITNEPTVYGRGSGNSYFLDVARRDIRGDADAITRLTRHAQELAVELPKREARRMARLREQEGRVARSDRNGFEPVYERRTNPNRTDGQGGYYVPPLWLIDEYIPFLRAGRTTADLCHGMELPGGTDSINLPKVASGTTTATQLDNGDVSSTDLTDTSVTAPVRTIAGQQDIAMQLLDQSPVAFDEVVFKDLTGSYNQQLDLQVIAGTGSSGQLKGITVMAGSNAVTYTDASPTVPELYLPLAQALSQIARLRLLPATAIVAHTMRAYWILSALDSSNRPLVTPSGAGYNPIGQFDTSAVQGKLANIIGTDVYGDANIPTNLGAGTNQDEVIAGKFDDAYLWEGELRTRALTEVLSGTLQVRLQLWNYVAFMPDRYPTSFSIIGGTGLIAPSGF